MQHPSISLLLTSLPFLQSQHPSFISLPLASLLHLPHSQHPPFISLTHSIPPSSPNPQHPSLLHLPHSQHPSLIPLHSASSPSLSSSPLLVLQFQRSYSPQQLTHPSPSACLHPTFPPSPARDSPDSGRPSSPVPRPRIPQSITLPFATPPKEEGSTDEASRENQISLLVAKSGFNLRVSVSGLAAPNSRPEHSRHCFRPTGTR